jgi:signal transduction histidine kinase
VAEIEIEDLVRYTARASVPERIALATEVAPGIPPVQGQYDALSRALSNLLLNAVEAVGDDGRIDVIAEPVQLGGAPAVRIAVRDSGPGISAEKLAGIWTPYVTEKPGGTGLGLAIVRQTVESHGGEVFASSTPGATEIGFAIPVNAGVPAIRGE